MLAVGLHPSSFYSRGWFDLPVQLMQFTCGTGSKLMLITDCVDRGVSDSDQRSQWSVPATVPSLSFCQVLCSVRPGPCSVVNNGCSVWTVEYLKRRISSFLKIYGTHGTRVFYNGTRAGTHGTRGPGAVLRVPPCRVPPTSLGL